MSGEGWRRRRAGGGSLVHPFGQPRSAGPGTRLTAPGGSRAPSELGRGLRCTGFSSAPAGRGFPRRQREGPSAAGAAETAQNPPLREVLGGGLDPPPLLCISSPHTPEHSCSPSAGKPFQGYKGAAEKGPLQTGAPSPRRRPFSHLPGGTGWVPVSRE